MSKCKYVAGVTLLTLSAILFFFTAPSEAAFLSGDSTGLGDHSAAKNIKLNTFWLSGDGDNEGIYINSAGRVGIGTTIPYGALHVNGHSYFGSSTLFQILDFDANYIAIEATSASDGNVKRPLLLNPWGGRVGINTTNTAAHALTIGSGGGTVSIGRDVNTGNLDIYGGTTYTNGAYFKVTGSALNTDGGNSSAEFTIGEQAGSYPSSFRLYSYASGVWKYRFHLRGDSGNIGIGKTNPVFKLDFASSTVDTINVGGGHIIGLHSTPTDPTHAVPLGYLQNNYKTSNWTVSGNNIYNANSGNVGIGTTNPAYKLSVDGYMSSLERHYFRDANSLGNQFDAAELSTYVYDDTPGSESAGLALKVRKNGASYYLLDFSDKLYLYSPLWIESNWTFIQASSNNSEGHDIWLNKSRGSYITQTQTLSGDNLGALAFAGYTGSAWTNKAAAVYSRATQAHSATGYGGEILLATTANSTTSLVDRMIITNNGNVGIGTTSPEEILDVLGDVRVSKNDGTAFLKIERIDNTPVANDPLGILGFRGRDSNLNRTTFAAIRGISSTVIDDLEGGKLQFETRGGSPSSLTIRMVILEDGNVGIGTTAPTAKLDVSGTVKLGTAGTAFASMGTCTIDSTAISTTKTNYTCTGVPASTAVAVSCSGAGDQSGAGTLYCRATGTLSQVACNTSAANTTAMAWTCLWARP